MTKINDDKALEQVLQSQLTLIVARYKQGEHHNEEEDKGKIHMEEVLEIQNLVAKAEKIPMKEAKDNITISQDEEEVVEKATSTIN